MSSTDAGVRIVDVALLDELSERAAASPRKRMNHNFHRDDDVVHRLLNAVEPDSYIPPHRHLDPAKAEPIVALRGSFGLVLFDEGGTVQRCVTFGSGGQAVAVELPPGQYHSLVSLEPGGVFFEAKAGPYRPLSPEERAPWAPAEGTPEAAAYFAHLRGLFDRAD